MPSSPSSQPRAASHSSRVCPFCTAVFSRVDATRRHAQRCPQKGDRTLQKRKRGRRLKSCDTCTRTKAHCNVRDRHPCDRCAARQIDCTFTRDLSEVPRQPLSANPSQHEPASDRYGHKIARRGSLSFLLNVTDDRQDFVSEKEVGDEPDGPLLGPTGFTLPPPSQPSQQQSELPSPCIDPTLLLTLESTDFLTSGHLDGLYDMEGQDLLGAFLSPQPEEDRLSMRLGTLETHVAAHAPIDHPFDVDAFRSFFSPAKVQMFAATFCRKRHYQYPILHWPSFTAEGAALPLLMVVALTGATYSYRQVNGSEHITEARKLYGLADSYIFRQLDKTLSQPPSVSEAIQVCQAALLMYGLENLPGGTSAMRTVAVSQRLPTLVSAIRRLQLVRCRHDPSEGWEEFLHREQIVRLVTWTFCTDCLATLAVNHPPVFSLLEMVGDLPCDPEIWDMNPETALEEWRVSRGDPLCLRDLMTNWMRDDGRDQSKWDNVPIFHLHVMLCAMQHVIFNMHVSLCLPTESKRVLSCLDTWGILWKRAIDKASDDYGKWLGVARHGADIHKVCKSIVEVAVSSRGSCSSYLERNPSHSLRDLHEFIREFIQPQQD